LSIKKRVCENNLFQDYHLNIHPLRELVNRKVQEESNEPTAQ